MSLAVDGAKVQRAREKMMEMATQRGEDKTEASEIKCIMFDSRIDKTKVQHYDEETDKCYPRLESEDHYTMTDGEGRYLHHFTKPGKKQNDSDDEFEEEPLNERSEETLSQSRVQLKNLINDFATSFKVKIQFDHFRSQNNSAKISLK